MFNFNLMNRALKDAELKDAFRMLYYIVNKCSLKNSMSVEIFDAEFELALSISPRSTCRFTKKLEERGYIKKEIRGTSQNKLANIYTLIDTDTKDDKIDTLTDNANIDGSSDGRIDTLKNINKINKKYNIHVNIHDNINTGNSDAEIKDLRIEENINLNNENEMNEERMNGMNNINNSNKTDINNSTLEERLGTQSLDDNTTGNFKNTGNKYPQEEQERYHRLFDNCKSQIEIWTKTHEYSCISIFDSYFKVIQYMNDQHLISDKQWEASQRHLLQRFLNLRNGYSNYLQNKKKTISSIEFNKCKNPQPPRQQNGQMEEAV